jgi:starvation-inducible outer membrane lipoprotein
VSPRWVVERVKSFYKVVGLSCDRFEDKLMTLFEEIEATRDQSIAKTVYGYLHIKAEGPAGAKAFGLFH